ncbi:MAG: hypothetical protein H7Y00_04485 [Fimbriimonadaceae bacterium]|nr:hypothetical protein [Chitinophagales bacterium]
MKKNFFYLSILFFLFSSCAKNDREPGPLTDGLEEVVSNKIYVMHSMIYADNKPWTTSNIFVIKGTKDTVWIYGSGYGDFRKPCDDSCNDNNYYLGDNFYGTGPATEDVRPIDSVITNIFKINRDSAILQFIVPHYHLDHINSEFIDAFYTTFNYPLNPASKIWIHVNDSIGALCNEPCCGTQPCPDKKNKYYGVPYMPSWKPAYKSMFKTMGSESDICNTVIKTFSSENGVWEITKGVAVADDGHTDGTINLNNADLKLRINGTKSKVQCDLQKNWTSVSVHGNIHPVH